MSEQPRTLSTAEVLAAAFPKPPPGRRNASQTFLDGTFESVKTYLIEYMEEQSLAFIKKPE